jgi:hypothetical protein
MCACGAETITAATPGGRDVELDFDHVWVRADERWPQHIYRIGTVPAGGGRQRAYATPALKLDRRPDGKPSGPFRREHACA